MEEVYVTRYDNGTGTMLLVRGGGVSCPNINFAVCKISGWAKRASEKYGDIFNKEVNVSNFIENLVMKYVNWRNMSKYIATRMWGNSCSNIGKFQIRETVGSKAPLPTPRKPVFTIK